MADKEQPRLPSHRAYSVIRRDGQDDFWLNIGLVFPHKDEGGFNIEKIGSGGGTYDSEPPTRGL
jgi:hypothetical protein